MTTNWLTKAGRGRIRYPLFCVLICGVVLAALLFYFATNPSGTYYLAGFDDDRFITFTGGSVYEDTPEARNKLVSSYFRLKGNWCVGSDTNNVSMLINSSILGIRTKSMTTNAVSAFYPRYGFAWLCDVLAKLGR